MATTGFGSFLPEEEFKEFDIKHELLTLVLTETYNEFTLKDSINKVGKEICCAVAIQLAIVGYGNRNFGKVKFNNVEIEIVDFFKKNGIRSDLTINSKLTPFDITPRRLIRFFRFQIRDYVLKHKDCQSYLFKKYCLNKDELTRSIIFPGFEHIADPNIDSTNVKLLLETYEYLDFRLGTHIKDRIVRVLVARGFNKNSLQNYNLNELK